MVLNLRSSIQAIPWAVLKRQIRHQFPTVQHLSTHELATWLQQEDAEKPLLLDARSLEEYEVSHLLNAKLAPTKIEELTHEVNRSTPIVAYCSVGYRSSALAQQLQALGYTHVFNLEGSLFQWANEDRPVYQNAIVTKQVHPYNQTWGLLLNPEYKQI